MTSINVVIKEPFANSTYVLATVWVGPDPESRKTCGTLHMTWDEAHELERRVMRGEPGYPGKVDRKLRDQAVEAARMAIMDSCGLRVTEGTARDAVNAYFRAIAHTDPPEGWFYFGTHVWVLPEGIGLRFSDERDEVGDPLWEQLVILPSES